MFKKFITERDIPECKKFIDSYVERVEVFKEHVEVTFKVAFSLRKKEDCYYFKSSIVIKNLFIQHREAV